MPEYIQRPDGKMAGSIGDGKTNAPTSPISPPAPRTSDPLAAPKRKLLDAITWAEDFSEHAATSGSLSVEALQHSWKAVADAAVEYWSAKLDQDTPQIDDKLARRGEEPLTERERLEIISNAALITSGQSSRKLPAFDLAYSQAYALTFFGPGGRLPQRGWRRLATGVLVAGAQRNLAQALKG